MDNFWFKVVKDEVERSLFILADSYENAIDKLFDKYSFDNYEFMGLK